MKETAMINSISHKNEYPPQIQPQQLLEINSLQQQYQQISQQNQVKSKILTEMYQKQSSNNKSHNSQQSLSQFLNQDSKKSNEIEIRNFPNINNSNNCNYSNINIHNNTSGYFNSSSLPYSEVNMYSNINSNTIENASLYSLPISNPSPRSSFANQSFSSSKNIPVNGKTISLDIQQQLQSLYDPQIIQSVLGTLANTSNNSSSNVTFDSIAGLENSKRILHEAITLPLIVPEFFDGVCEPWKGILLFGPPGTGKTMLVKAICNSGGYKFFNTSSSNLISKYRGDTEKIIRCLFHAATLCAPSIIFIDEIDSLLNNRNNNDEHEASRRMKTEFFIHLDGLNSNNDKKVIMLFFLLL